MTRYLTAKKNLCYFAVATCFLKEVRLLLTSNKEGGGTRLKDARNLNDFGALKAHTVFPVEAISQYVVLCSQR